MSSPNQQDSVLARYVQRFRYGEPRSRAERPPLSPAAGREEAQLFWWMSPSSPPSSPTPQDSGNMDDTAALKEDQDPGRRGELGTSRPYREPLDIGSLDLSDSSLGDRWDTEGVQESASRLLQRSESSVSSGSLVISSEGLGGSDLSSPLSVNEPVRRPFFPCLIESTTCNTSSSSPTVGPSQKSYVPSPSISRQRPEEDILFQWRLRRKMEQASHWPQAPSQQFPSLQQIQPPSAWQTPTLHQPPSALQNPSLHQHQPPSALQNPSLHQHQPPSGWQNPSLHQHQPPSALQNPSLHQHQPPSGWQNPSLHQHQPPSALQNPSLHQPPPAWQNPSLHQHQPPSALQNPSLRQPPPAWQNPSLHQHQPPSALQNPSLHQPPPAWQNPSLHQHQPPSALQNPSLHQPPPAGQGPSLHQHQPPPAGQTSSLHQPSIIGSMEHMCLEQQHQSQGPEPSQRTAPSILPSPQLGSKETQGPCPPAAGPPSTSIPRPASSQTASRHQPAREPLLWDGSPGPVRSSFPTTQPKALGRPPTNIGPKHPQPIVGTVANPSPAAGGREPESCPPPGSSEPTKDERSSDTKPSQKQKTAHRKQKRCARRPAGDGPGPQTGGCSRPRLDRMAASAPQRLSPNKDPRQRESQALHQGVCSAQCAPPSPVHLALRQAVSEVLFPARRASSSSSVPPRCAQPTPPRPQGPDGSGQPPEEVLSQLLRDAENSDGEEFGDDSLLQVLRKQRTRVKDQISQVDSLLEEFTPEGEEA